MALLVIPKYVTSFSFLFSLCWEVWEFGLIWRIWKTGCGKFALRALSQCLAREFQPQGVHIAHVIIDGVLGPPSRSSFLPSLPLSFTLHDIIELLIIKRKEIKKVNSYIFLIILIFFKKKNLVIYYSCLYSKVPSWCVSYSFANP